MALYEKQQAAAKSGAKVEATENAPQSKEAAAKQAAELKEVLKVV